MEVFWKSYKSEFLKMKHSLFLWLHLVIPLGLVFLLTSFCLSRRGDLNYLGVFKSFFEIIGFAFPLIIAILAGLVASQEEQAGCFQNILGKIPSKVVSFISQLCMLLTLGFASLAVAMIGFVVSMKWILHVSDLDVMLFIKIGLLTFTSVIFQYSLYQVLGYLFGIGVCSLIGFLGTIVAALSETGQGDLIWTYLPWAWAIRFSNGIVDFQFNSVNFTSLQMVPDYQKGLILMTIMTVCCIVVSVLWFCYWEGKHLAE